MAVVERTAEISWEGDVRDGGGVAELTTSGVGGQLPMSLPTRIDDPEGRTSPEELIAAAHAGCYAMALSNVLTTDDNPPERLEVRAKVTLDREGEGLKLSRSDLTVRGTVAGLDAAAFEEAAQRAERECAVSNALRGSLEISVEASLEEE